MKHFLDDGRVLVASYNDIRQFFDDYHIVGRTISDLRSAENDYMIKNLEDFDIDELNRWTTESGIETDGQIAILFADGDNIEIEFSGDGPILLGFNTANLSKYPAYDGTCYTLATLFQHCLGKTISNVLFEKSNHRMEFPAYRGIDMSADDEGIREIRLILEDGSYLKAFGGWDFYYFSHINSDGEELRIPYTELIEELNPKVKHRLFVEHKGV